LVHDPKFAILLASLRAGICSGLVGVAVLEEDGGRRGDHAGRPQQLGLEHRVLVGGAAGVALGQAIRTMPLFKGQVIGGVDQDQQAALHPRRVEHLVADQTPQHQVPQPRQRGRPDADEEVVGGLVDGQADLPGGRQAVEVVQQVWVALGQLVVELASGAEFEQEQRQAQPQQEALVVDDAVSAAAVWDLIEPTVEVGPEVQDGADQGRPDVQLRFALRF
jgi:hypothetical protein